MPHIPTFIPCDFKKCATHQMCHTSIVPRIRCATHSRIISIIYVTYSRVIDNVGHTFPLSSHMTLKMCHTSDVPPINCTTHKCATHSRIISIIYVTYSRVIPTFIPYDFKDVPHVRCATHSMCHTFPNYFLLKYLTFSYFLKISHTAISNHLHTAPAKKKKNSTVHPKTLHEETGEGGRGLRRRSQALSMILGICCRVYVRQLRVSYIYMCIYLNVCVYI